MAWRVVRWVALALASLALLAAAALLALDTQPGRRFIADRLAAYTTASGITIRTSRIDGSIYGRMLLHDVEVSDPRGVFVVIPALTLDWRPFAYLHRRIDVRELTAPTIVMLRNPALKPVPSDPNAPTLPDIDLDVDRLEIGRLDLRAPVTGQRHVVRLAGAASIANGRAQIRADGRALKAAGIAGGDRLHVVLDAVPDADRFDLDAHLAAPRGGLVDSYAKLGKPLTLDIGGTGDWADWHGTVSGLLGSDRLADLRLAGRGGTFRLTGAVRPALALQGSAARLAAPAIQLDATATLARRVADTRLVARSDAFALTAAGRLDFARGRFGGVTVEARLLEPGSIAPDVRGRDVRLAATLDGAFVTPTIDYRLTAAALGFGTTGIEGLAAEGHARIDAERIVVPVHATARAVTGLDAAAGGRLTRLRADGDLAYRDGKLASDDLRLRSDRIDATAILLADLGRGSYTGALKGRVNDYRVNGLGRIDLITDARLVPGRGGGFAIAGHVRAATVHVDNAAVAAQLGGKAVATADVGYDLAGGAVVRNLRLASPRLHISRGDGAYRPDGRILLHAVGQSADYGPISLDVGGTVAQPRARLRAMRPGLGIGLSGLEANLEARGGGYRIRAQGASAYGPLDADVTLRPGAGGARLDIAAATLAGIRLSGSVVQTGTGPYAGTLTLAGAGLNGGVRLAAEGSTQRADIDLRASAARLPGPAPVTIGSGTVRLTVLLPVGGTPSVTGRLALADVRGGGLVLAHAQGTIDYRGGQGRVALVATGGQAGTPFGIAAQARLAPTRIIANLTGTLNGVAIRLASPAVATRGRDGWQLAPATVLLPQGQLDVSGRVGAVIAVHAVLRTLDLSIVQAFAPGLGLGGKASGTLDYVGHGAVPYLRARIDVAGFTRTAALTVSDPVDLALLATLNGNGGDVRALIRGRGAIVGRLQARLEPLGPGTSLADRLLAAPLSGGIRYNGPAELPWALTGIARQQLSGPLALGADFGGRLSQPTVTGIVRASALRYENGIYGTVLSNIALGGRFTQSRFELTQLTAKAGGGGITARGSVGLAAADGFPIDLTATLDKAKLAQGDDVDATVSGILQVTNSKAGGGLIKGDLTVPQARYKIVKAGAAEVPALTGVHRKGAPPPGPADEALPSSWKLDVHLRAPDRIFVSGMGLEAEWRTDMRVTGAATQPSVVGRLEVVRGTYSFSGRRFDLDHGLVTFLGPLLNPALDIAASTTVEGVSATIDVGGYAQAPQISFTSTPTLPQDEVLSRLLFGASVASLSPVQALQLAAALNSLRGSSGRGLDPLGKLRSASGIDRLRVLGADKNTGQGTSLAAGKYISNKVYVEVITDARGFTATQLEISLSRALSVLSSTGSFGGSNVSLQYKKTY